MNDTRRLALGFLGIALGNGFTALGSWLRGNPVVSTAGQLVVPLAMAVLAAGYVFDVIEYDPPTEGRVGQWLPTLVALIGVVIAAVGTLLLVVTLLE